MAKNILPITEMCDVCIGYTKIQKKISRKLADNILKTKILMLSASDVVQIMIFL